MMIRAQERIRKICLLGGLTTLALAAAPDMRAETIDHIKMLTASDAAAQSHFGWSVALDNNECFIGAKEHAQGGVFASGAVYIHSEDLGGVDNWGFLTKRHEFVPAIHERYGWSVGMAGEYAAVGVWGDADLGFQSGGVYLYKRNFGMLNAWALETKLLASDGAAVDHFGYSVDMDTDVVIVGAALVGDNVGAAYIFQRNFGGADNWGQSKQLLAPIPEIDSFYGISVAVHNGIAAVGAFKDDALGLNSGAVYVYEELPAGAPEGPGARSGTWKFVKKLVAPGGDSHNNFGDSVSVNNGMVMVGATGHQTETNIFGAAYLFHRNQGGAGSYGFVKKFSNHDDDNVGDSWGRSVDVDGDIAIIGVSQDGSPHPNSPGRVYVYERNIGGADNWGFLFRVEGPDPMHSDQFGYDVDLQGDIFVVGSIGDSDGGSAAGSAHVFRINSICPEDLNGDGMVDAADLGIMLGSFGESGLGDLNLDGVIDAADLGILLGGFSETDCAFGT